MHNILAKIHRQNKGFTLNLSFIFLEPSITEIYNGNSEHPPVIGTFYQ